VTTKTQQSVKNQSAIILHTEFRKFALDYLKVIENLISRYVIQHKDLFERYGGKKYDTRYSVTVKTHQDALLIFHIQKNFTL